MKKILSVLLSILMLVSIIPAGAISASAAASEMNYSFTASRSNLASSLTLVPVSKDVFDVTVVLDSAPLEFYELENTEGVNWGFYTSDGKYVDNDYHAIRSGNEMVPTLTLEMNNVNLKAGESYRLYCMATEYDYQLDYDVSVTGADDYVTFFVGVPITKDYFPDDEFRASIGSVDDDGDGYVLQTECDFNKDGILTQDELDEVRGVGLIGNENCHSVEGINYFKNTRNIDFSGSGITSIDLSNLSKLNMLSLVSTSVSSVDLSHNPNIEYVYINEVASLRSLNLSNCTKLYDIDLRRTNVETVSIEDCTTLYTINLNSAKTKNLLLPPSDNNLQYLYVGDTNVTELDWSKLSNLREIMSTCITNIDLTNTKCFTEPVNGNVYYRHYCYYAYLGKGLTYNIKMTCEQKKNYDEYLAFDFAQLPSDILSFTVDEITAMQNAKTNIEVVHTAPTNGVDYKAPTCTEKGKTAGQICSVCKAVISGCTDVPATGHKTTTTVTKATTSKNGSKVTKCTVCGTQTAKSTVYYPKTITLSTTKYTYDGKAKKPTVKVVDANGKTISASNYTVTYPSGRKNVGKYTVKIIFKGNYSGTVSKTFTIVPKGTTISSLSAVSKGFTVKWSKQATQTTGYQIQIATDSGFTKGVKSYDVTKNSTVSKKITKLTGKKKYYVRIRTYKTVSGTKYYSSWSGSKTVTTKK